MSGIVLMLVVVLVAVVASSVFRSVVSRRRKRELLDAIAAAVGGTRDGYTITCQRDGVWVALHYTTYADGNHQACWTQIDVAIPRQYPLSLSVRKHIPNDASRIASGSLVDVDLGDAAFDREFLVEAAPADVVRALLDAPFRDWFRRHPSSTLTTEQMPNLLRLMTYGWLDQPAAAVEAIGAIARVGSRVREAFAAADAAIGLVETGTPYRPEVDDTALREASAARTTEVAQLDAARRTREAWQFVWLIGIMLAGLALVGVIASL